MRFTFAKAFILVMLCLAFVTGCSDRENKTDVANSDLESSSSQPVAQSSDISKPEASAPTVVPWSPADYPDPTLEENMQASFYNWEHLEYHSFGSVEEYVSEQTKIPNYFLDPEKDFLTISLNIPKVYQMDDASIMYDGGFKNGLLPVGGIIGYQETAYDNSKSFVQNGFDITSSFSTAIMMGGASYDMVEKDENSIGSYIQTDKFIRCIYEGILKNNDVIYLLKVASDKYFVVSLQISASADAQALSLLNSIVDSIALAI